MLGTYFERVGLGQISFFFSVSNLIEKLRPFNFITHFAFADYEDVLDHVNRDIL
jgi:hypothetical protein